MPRAGEGFWRLPRAAAPSCLEAASDSPEVRPNQTARGITGSRWLPPPASPDGNPERAQGFLRNDCHLVGDSSGRSPGAV